MNRTDAYIDGVALSSIGVHMGDSFISTLMTPATLKDFATNDARTRNGVQILTSSPRRSSRDLSLTFIICGDTPEELTANEAKFYELIGNIRVGLFVPAVSEEATFWLTYTGKNVTYSIDLARTVSKFTGKFTEADPTSRGLASWVADL